MVPDDGSGEIDLDQIRGSGLRVLERRQFSARGYLSVPEPRPGVHSHCTYAVDLDRALALSSTTTAMDPETADEQPFLSDEVITWSTREGLLVPLPSEAAGSSWACVPDQPLIQGPLAMLLWLVGTVTARATPSGAACTAVVGVDRALAHVPSEYRAALQRSFEESALAFGSNVELEVRLSGSAVETVDVDLPADEGSRPRILLHVSSDAGCPLDLPAPPVAGLTAAPDEIAHAWVADRADDLPDGERPGLD